MTIVPHADMTSLPIALFDIGGPEVLLVMVAILLLFGGQRLPELAKGLGRSMREFKKASAGVEEEIRRAIEAAPEPAPRATPPAPAQPLPVSTPGVAATTAAVAAVNNPPPPPVVVESPKPPFDEVGETKA